LGATVSTNATGNFINLAPDTYTVTVTDQSGCITVSSTNLNFTSGPSVIPTATPETCSGQNNGSISLSVSPSGTYGFEWSNGATSQNINNLGAGIYSVTVTDPISGCSEVINDTVNANVAINASFNISNPSTGTSTDGLVVLNVSGGTAPYTYAWSNGSTSDFVQGLQEGSYTVTITDANGCFIVRTIALTGIEINEQITGFVIMPNPSNGYFTVQIDLANYQNASLRLTDVLGRTIHEQQLEGQSFTIPMDWDRLAGGTYFITLQTADTYKTQKVVISK
jgi:hypothetical protein